MMLDLRQRCQDLEAENHELRTRLIGLEARLSSAYDGGIPVLRDASMMDAHGACSPQASDGSGASVGARGLLPRSAPAGNAVQLHQGQPTNIKTANKLRFTAAAAPRRVAPEPKPSPAGTFSGSFSDSFSPPPCHGSGTGRSHHLYTWSLPSGTASAVCESSEQPQAVVPLQGTQLKRRPAGAGVVWPTSSKTRAFHRCCCDHMLPSYIILSHGVCVAVCVASAAGKTRLPAQGIISSAMVVFVAMSCLVLLSIPALHLLSLDNRPQFSGSSRTSRPANINSNMHGRALLSAASETDERSVSALAPLGDARVMPYASWNDGHEGDAGPWMASSDDAEQILESAAFVCNRTACVAIPVDGAWADVVPMQPLEVRTEQPGARDLLHEAVFSTLEDVTPAGDKSSSVPMQYISTAPLRGGGFVGEPEDGEEEDDCGGVSCFSFQHLAGKAMNMAGLISPEMCELVHRSTFNPGVMEDSEIITQQPHQSSTNATVVAQPGYATGPMVPHNIAERGNASKRYRQRPNSSQGVENSTGHAETGDTSSDHMLSVLFPVWADDASDESALTPIRHMYVFVLDQQDLLTYQCSMSRPLYM